MANHEVEEAKIEQFAEEFVKAGGNATAAAKAIGYAESGASTAGRRLLCHKSFPKYLKKFTKEFIDTTLAIKALMVLERVLDSPKAADEHKISASKDILDRSSFKRGETVDHNVGIGPGALIRQLYEKQQQRQIPGDNAQPIEPIEETPAVLEGQYVKKAENALPEEQ